MLDCVDDHISSAHSLLSQVIDPDQVNSEEGSAVIAAGVCEELDTLKDTYEVRCCSVVCCGSSTLRIRVVYGRLFQACRYSVASTHSCTFEVVSGGWRSRRHFADQQTHPTGIAALRLVCTYVYTCTYVYICIYVYICTYVYMYICMQA